MSAFFFVAAAGRRQPDRSRPRLPPRRCLRHRQDHLADPWLRVPKRMRRRLGFAYRLHAALPLNVVVGCDNDSRQLTHCIWQAIAQKSAAASCGSATHLEIVLMTHSRPSIRNCTGELDPVSFDKVPAMNRAHFGSHRCALLEYELPGHGANDFKGAVAAIAIGRAG